MNIVLLEPCCTATRQRWAEDFARYSKHKVHLLTLPAKDLHHATHQGTIALAQKLKESNLKPDLILATDSLDLSTFLGLTRSLITNIPIAVYFHENQLGRDEQLGIVNYTTTLAADKVFFNSEWHRRSFLDGLQQLLLHLPDIDRERTIASIKNKSEVLAMGMDLTAIDRMRPEKVERPMRAVIGWNHRWAYDKDPETFFRALYTIADRGVDFRVIILGQAVGTVPACFEEFRKDFPDRILHYGYVDSYEEYILRLCQCDILPVTSKVDFFGTSVIEALYCDVMPFLPQRLAYPEHLPEKYNTMFFYHNFEDMVNRLHRRIMDVRVLRLQKLGQYINRYDWSVMAVEYDERLSQLV